MVDLIHNSRLSERLEAYAREVEALERKLRNGAPAGKQDRRAWRLADLRRRLIPALYSRSFI